MTGDAPIPDVAAARGAGQPAPAATAPEQEVRTRRVLFVHGYDPQKPEHYRRFFALELRKFCKTWGAFARVSPGFEQAPGAIGASWVVSTRAGAAQVETTFEVLRWDDIVARDFAIPLPLKLFHGQMTLWHMFASGLFMRFAQVAPWYAFAWFYPFAAYMLCTAASVLAGWGLAVLAGRAGLTGPAAAALGLVAGFWICVGLMEALRRAGTYVVHLIDDGRSQRRYVMRRDAALHARIDAFADRIRAVAETADVDEVVVVGHSSGSFVAIDAVARAYERAPTLGDRVPLALLTLGSTELLVALHPKAGWLRDRIARLAVEPRLFWAEFVGVWDTLNFARRDPVTELGLDVPEDRPNPAFRRTFITKMLRQPTIDELRRRWKVFRVHFQFIMGNEVQGPYDYYSMICGPWLARSQFERTKKGAFMSPHLGKPPRPPKRPTS